MFVKKVLTAAAGAAAITLLAAGPALAAVTYDPATGGFAGKGDVQLAFDLSNKQLQDAVKAEAIQFNYISTDVTEVSWTCTNDKDTNKTQERERTTTTQVSALESAWPATARSR